jgi:SAM-dependent methyltransferase
MARAAARYKIPPAAQKRRQEALGVAADSVQSTADYLERNRVAWEQWAPQYATAGRAAWQESELYWGIWNLPESELKLFDGLPRGADAIELGCGTAAISAWLARNGCHPVAVDIARPQLETVRRLQSEFGVDFPYACENAERLAFDDESFDVAVSEYGASLWCDPSRWLPEAHRVLRPGGVLLFVTNAPMLMVCTPDEGGAPDTELHRDYFSTDRVEFAHDGPVEFHPAHGEWIRLLHSSGFVVEDLIEIQPAENATPRFDFVSIDWARRWPSEEVWIARKAAK